VTLSPLCFSLFLLYECFYATPPGRHNPINVVVCCCCFVCRNVIHVRPPSSGSDQWHTFK